MKNITASGGLIRVSIGTLITILATHFQIWWGVGIGIIFIYAGVSRYCPTYAIFGVKEREAEENFYLSQLPKHNSEPVYLFNSAGELRFRNSAAENILPNLTSISELAHNRGKTIQKSLEENEHFYERFDAQGLSYIVRFKAVKEIDTILAYAFNITEIMQANEEILNTQKELVYRMGEIGETRSKETGNHVRRVAEYSYLLAKLYGMDEDEAGRLKMASPMHDIGKVAIPDTILNKPGRLDESEWQMMQTHTTIGHQLLSHSDRPILKAAAIVAGEHHERWDGSGYPNALKGEKIHIFGRITAIADVFDALGNDRVYKKAWRIEQILELFKSERGGHFDPHLMDIFLSNLDGFLDIKKSLTS